MYSNEGHFRRTPLPVEVGMIIGVSVERNPWERRVALVPSAIPTLAKAGFEVYVEPGAGLKAGFPDAAYEKQGARLAKDRTQLFSSADNFGR